MNRPRRRTPGRSHAGVVATHTLGRLVRQLGAAGGVQITASHNPPEYNGLKLFGADGRVISQEFGERTLTQYQRKDVSWATADRVGDAQVIDDTVTDHLNAVLALVDVPRIQNRKFRVLLDANAGAGSVLGLPLLRTLGCECHCLGSEPDGDFRHPPEPVAENLAAVGEDVRRTNAAVGFCQDPDADRLALIDHEGQFIGEEYTLALCVHRILQDRPGPIVTNCSTSRMTEELARRAGVPFYRSRVGEAHVADLMMAQNAVFGGEGNGGPIEPRVGYVRDSFVGMALILDSLAAGERTLRQLVEELPRYAMVKSKAAVDASALEAVMTQLCHVFRDAEKSQLDGTRWDWPDRWILLRASNTEPIVRIVAEAPSQPAAEELVQRAMAILKHP